MNISTHLSSINLSLKTGRSRVIENKGLLSGQPKPTMYITIIAMWLAAIFYFQPRLWSLLEMAYDFQTYFVLISFILFIDFAWLYGFFNLGILLYAFIYNHFEKKPAEALSRLKMVEFPSVAILYTTYNDLVEESLLSCIDQDYPNYKVYVLDDSTDHTYQNMIDQIADRFPEVVEVVRRKDRIGFKAGNMNHGLNKIATEEPYFAIADADEILPRDFLSKLVPVMESDGNCGFVQANHQCNPQSISPLAKSMGVGIDIHWKYYQPLRNAYGFVMFLGHGALIRRECWEKIGGFPHIVSEDLGFAIKIRELGYRGRFLENVTCYEDFPEDVRSFRIRHMKWTRGTSEFLHKMFWPLVKSKNITWTEKLDILFPTLNLPLTLVYFIFMVIANIALPYYFGEIKAITLVWAGQEWILPILALAEGFSSIYSWDFYLITMLTFFAPILCFIVGLIKTPIRMVRFISHSTALYAALGPLSSLGVIGYLISKKAIFLVTGDKSDNESNQKKESKLWSSINSRWEKFIGKTHPEDTLVKTIEVGIGILFAALCLLMFQISFFGLCLAFIFLPLLTKLSWNHPFSKIFIHVPFVLIMLGILLAGGSLMGMQTIFFSYGFHF